MNRLKYQKELSDLRTTFLEFTISVEKTKALCLLSTHSGRNAYKNLNLIKERTTASFWEAYGVFLTASGVPDSQDGILPA